MANNQLRGKPAKHLGLWPEGGMKTELIQPQSISFLSFHIAFTPNVQISFHSISACLCRLAFVRSFLVEILPYSKVIAGASSARRNYPNRGHLLFMEGGQIFARI